MATSAGGCSVQFVSSSSVAAAVQSDSQVSRWWWREMQNFINFSDRETSTESFMMKFSTVKFGKKRFTGILRIREKLNKQQKGTVPVKGYCTAVMALSACNRCTWLTFFSEVTTKVKYKKIRFQWKLSKSGVEIFKKIVKFMKLLNVKFSAPISNDDTSL